jgi:hypothetical protein
MRRKLVIKRHSHAEEYRGRSESTHTKEASY